MILRYLLDTSVLSAAIAQKPPPGLLERLEQHADECALAAPVWHELRYGTRRLPRGKRRAALERYLDEIVRPSLPILPYDEAAADWHAHERTRLEAKGRSVPFVDGQIASVARVNALIVVTTNRRDFAPFAGLEIEDWTRNRRS